MGGGRAAPNQHSLLARDKTSSSGVSGSVAGTVLGEMNDVSQTVADGISSAFMGTADSMTNAMQDNNEYLTTFVKDSSSTAADFVSKTTGTAQNLVKSGGRYTLSLGNLFTQLFNPHPTVPERHSLSVRAPESGDTVNAANSAVKNTGDGLTSLLSNTGEIIKDLGSETSKSVEEVLKAGGRATLAFGNLCTQLLNGLSFTLAMGSGYLASGLNNVHGYLGRVPILGVVSSGISKFVDGLSTYVNETSESGRGSRRKMINNFREQLNGSGGNVDQSSTATTATGASNSS